MKRLSHTSSDDIVGKYVIIFIRTSALNIRIVQIHQMLLHWSQMIMLMHISSAYALVKLPFFSS